MSAVLLSHPKPTTSAVEGASLGERRLWTGCLVVFLTERLGFDVAGNDLPLALLLIPALLAYALFEKSFVVSRVRAVHFGWAAAALGAVTLVHSIGGRTTGLSFLFVLVVYAFTMAVPRSMNPGALDRCEDRLLQLTMIAASAAIFQFALQILGAPFVDPIGALPQVLTLDNYVATYPIRFGSSILRSNGLVFLEASLLSQFLAIGLLIEIRRRARVRRIALLCLGLVTTFSGTGLILLGIGLVLVHLSRTSARGRSMLATFLVLLAVPFAAASPLGDVLGDRLDYAVNSDQSSGQGRFVLPWTLMLVSPPGGTDAGELFIGRGPGSSAALSVDHPSLAEPPFLKLWYEYGAIGLAALGSYLTMHLLALRRSWTLGLVVAFQYLLLQSNLLNHVVVTLMVLVGVSARADGRRKPRS